MINNNNQLSSDVFDYQQEVLDVYNDRITEIQLFFDLIEKCFDHFSGSYKNIGTLKA